MNKAQFIELVSQIGFFGSLYAVLTIYGWKAGMFMILIALGILKIAQLFAESAK